MKRTSLRLAVAFVALLVAAFIALRLMSMSDGVSSLPAVNRPWFMVFGVALLALPPIVNALLWRDILCRLDRTNTSIIDGVAAFCASWPGRYVPSSLPYLAGKFVLGTRLGHSRPALAASVLYEHALLVSLGAVSSAIVIPLMLAGGSRVPWVFLSAAFGGAIGLALLSPRVMQAGISVAARLARKDAMPKMYLLSHRDMLFGATLALAALAFQAMSFSFVMASFLHLSWRELIAAGAIFNLAAVAGIVVLPVPSGLGVREGVLIALLQAFVPIELAAAATLVARFGNVLVDIGVGLIGGAVFAVRQARVTRASEAPPSPAPQQLDAA